MARRAHAMAPKLKLRAWLREREAVVSATILQWHGDEALRGAAPPAAGGGARGDAAREAGDRGGAVGGGGVQRVILPRQWQKRRTLSYTRNK